MTGKMNSETINHLSYREQSNILVSVSMITYNHEAFIAEAIEGVVMQKTTFPFELVIGEDCSTDNTRAICIEYQKKYPDIIRLRLPEKNQGMMLNWINNIESGHGKYIALCDGDDYWTDPYKLQKQVDFMEVNPDFALCSHSVYTLMCGQLDENIEMERDVLTTEDIILKDWGLLTASMSLVIPLNLSTVAPITTTRALNIQCVGMIRIWPSSGRWSIIKLHRCPQRMPKVFGLKMRLPSNQ